uniref:Chondroitin proteoglycan 3 n=1 Tax=Globodera pallida TaxID=36090 RepID=A0A183CHB4_GLOPA
MHSFCNNSSRRLFILLVVFGGLVELLRAPPSVDFDDEEERNFFRTANNVTQISRTKKCILGAECTKHSDCGQAESVKKIGTGARYCKGIKVGKCDCSACKKYWRCKNDVMCGGLKGSCQANGHCDCYSAARKFYKSEDLHGSKAKNAAYVHLCHMDNCATSGDCFGLPCLKGECVC